MQRACGRCPCRCLSSSKSGPPGASCRCTLSTRDVAQSQLRSCTVHQACVVQPGWRHRTTRRTQARLLMQLIGWRPRRKDQADAWHGLMSVSALRSPFGLSRWRSHVVRNLSLHPRVAMRQEQCNPCTDPAWVQQACGCDLHQQESAKRLDNRCAPHVPCCSKHYAYCVRISTSCSRGLHRTRADTPLRGMLTTALHAVQMPLQPPSM